MAPIDKITITMAWSPLMTITLCGDTEFSINTGVDDGTEILIENVKDVTNIHFEIGFKRGIVGIYDLGIQITTKQNLVLCLGFNQEKVSMSTIYNTFDTIYNLIGPHMDIVKK
jgi:hypothetical protein